MQQLSEDYASNKKKTGQSQKFAYCIIHLYNIPAKTKL